MSSEKKTPGKEESKKTNNRRANYSSSRGVTESTLPRSPEASQDPAKTMKKLPQDSLQSSLNRKKKPSPAIVPRYLHLLRNRTLHPMRKLAPWHPLLS